jgi:hypothetical protein
MRVPSTKDFPDHHDAELILKVYDLRRDEVLRDARRVITRDFWPTCAADVAAILNWEHPHYEAFGEVVSYWEMVYGLGRHGIVNADYLAESTSGEALILLAKLHPFLDQIRTDSAGPRFLRNTEWIAAETEAGREMYGRVQSRVAKLRSQR